MTIRAISLGGGVQSTALVVLAVAGDIDYPLSLFSNVGDDSEDPKTIDYMREHLRPFAEAHGHEIVELQKQRVRDVCDGEGMEATNVLPWSPIDGVPELEGSCPVCTLRLRFARGDEPVMPAHAPRETLLGRITRPGIKGVGIPVRMSNGAPGTRQCTEDFKILVIAKELKRRGATEADPARVAVGFSTDELHRSSNRRNRPWEIAEFPLLDLGLDRAACQRIIADAGLPVPPKSACYFCPFHRPSTWAEMRRDRPELFERAVLLERHLNDVRDTLQCTRASTPATTERIVESDVGDEPELEVVTLADGVHQCPTCLADVAVAGGTWAPHTRDHVYLTRFAKPLDEAIPEAQPSLFPMADDGPESCDEGHCWT